MFRFSRLASLFAATDEQMMWRLQTQDDHNAFAVLVGRWRLRVWNLCVRMTGDTHNGEDLTQEVFTRIYQKRKEYEPGKRFSTWLWRIALNRCYDELRRLARGREFSLEEEGGEGMEAGKWLADPITPHERVAHEEEAEMVRQALVRLPEIYRTVLVLRHYENLKLREIAEVLEVPEGTVNSRMAEGLDRLTRMLELQFSENTSSPKLNRRGAMDAERKKIYDTPTTK